jgi:hypothetical protein
MTVQSSPDTAALDETVADLRSNAEAWVALPLGEKIALLEGMRPRILAESEAMVAETQRQKGIDPSSSWGAEDWLSGPWAFLQGVTSLLTTLHRIDDGKAPLPLSQAQRRADGRTVVDVFPASTTDSLLLSGYRSQVWMQDGISPEQAVDTAADMYRGKGYPHPGVSLVLGAGNVGSITTLDILHVLYFEGAVAVVKMNPVNDYLSPFFARIFAEYVNRGWLRFVHGGADVGGYLAHHDGIDAIHMTGSAATHDAIVWGVGPEAEQRRQAGTPLLDKRITSELGGVSPMIVTPGPWTEADLQFQAEHIVSSKLNNAGHNCIATQVLVLPAEWDQSDALLERVRAVMRSLPRRPSYYPRSSEKVAHATDGQTVEELSGMCALVPDLDPYGAESLLHDEVFGGAMGVVRLPGADAPAFLRNAVAFSNEVLPGTLGASLLVDPATEKRYAADVDRAIADLRYGSVGVNAWSALAFLLGYSPWGAFPGHTLDDIGSGIGVVHNAFLLQGVQKCVSRMPFRPLHRAALKGQFHMSPKPPFFVTNKTGETTARRLTAYLATGKASALPGVFASALRG